MQDGISPQEVQTLFGTQDSADCTENLHEPNLDRIDAANPQALGFSGDMDPYVLQNYQYDSNGSFGFKQLSIQSVLRGNFPVQFLISQPSLFSSSRKENGVQEISPLVARGELEKMVSSDTGRRLISLFRTFVLPLYPIFSETRFPDPDTSPAYLLAAIYLVGQLFARFDEALSIELAYETLDSQALFRLIHEALQYESHAPGLETVQTLLLLVIRPSTNPLVLESSVKWSLHGLLVSTAQSLGLHYDPTSWKLPRWQISLRRRIAFSIFSVDKWLACSLGRPPLVSTDNWLVIRLEKEDVHASTIESDTWSHFLYYTQLGIYMDEALTRLYSMRAIQELSSDPTKTLSIAREILEKTSQWHREFSQQSHNSEEPNPLSTISLLGYHYVQMTIFRAIMRPFLAKPGAASGAQHSLNGNSSTDIQSVLGLARTGFRSATTAALTFVKELKEEHSRIFWPHWSQVAFSSICFIDLMMATSSPDTDEAVCWFQDLHVARREMRLKSTMLPVLRLGLLRIDAVFWKGLSRVMHLEPHVEKALQESLKPTST
ncbi:hypothetical protein BU24DRAFT_430123 [Aaosphaeria arxii CBS 175.79]|uniref:Xylanolytic transcriptional activator regulatory domain-containing protein n=1 Tax=Aaosphaeria arxii CBS 175.79 TaxID=1450172 RepID=A0A6A5Y9G3_9PLEO|nr:uncharacterized protein BU24DRAFT_430123 [Aaosphaeria arxii CBS 175.79]KAF2021450.1 hypothetical protein BU24DRAFT_430123 [Aaosphaeria arxii CBS 175.79]